MIYHDGSCFKKENSGFPIILQNSDQKNVYNIASSHIIRFKSYSGNFFFNGGRGFGQGNFSVTFLRGGGGPEKKVPQVTFPLGETFP